MCFKVEIGCVCSKPAYSAELKKHMYLSLENHLHLKLQHLAHYLPVRIELFFERNTSVMWVFQSGDWLSLIQIGLFS
jgi:hypothetical protein